MLEQLADDVLVHGGASARLRRLAALLVLIAEPLGRDQARLVAFAELGEFLVQAEEELELGGFLYRWNQS